MKRFSRLVVVFGMGHLIFSNAVWALNLSHRLGNFERLMFFVETPHSPFEMIAEYTDLFTKLVADRSIVNITDSILQSQYKGQEEGELASLRVWAEAAKESLERMQYYINASRSLDTSVDRNKAVFLHNMAVVLNKYLKSHLNQVIFQMSLDKQIALGFSSFKEKLVGAGLDSLHLDEFFKKSQGQLNASGYTANELNKFYRHGVRPCPLGQGYKPSLTGGY